MPHDGPSLQDPVAHPADEMTKLWRAASKRGRPGEPNSCWKISRRPPSAVSPSPARELQLGTTSTMPHSYAVGTTAYGATYNPRPAWLKASLSSPMTYAQQDLVSK